MQLWFIFTYFRVNKFSRLLLNMLMALLRYTYKGKLPDFLRMYDSSIDIKMGSKMTVWEILCSCWNSCCFYYIQEIKLNLHPEKVLPSHIPHEISYSFRVNVINPIPILLEIWPDDKCIRFHIILQVVFRNARSYQNGQRNLRILQIV